MALGCKLLNLLLVFIAIKAKVIEFNLGISKEYIITPGLKIFQINVCLYFVRLFFFLRQNTHHYH